MINLLVQIKLLGTGERILGTIQKPLRKHLGYVKECDFQHGFETFHKRFPPPL